MPQHLGLIRGFLEILPYLIFTYLSAAFQEKKIINDIAKVIIKTEKNTSSGVIFQNCALIS